MITIEHCYSTNVEVCYYSKDGYSLRHCHYGKMDDIAERVCEIIVKHNFSYADVCSIDTGELLLVVKRS